MYRTLSSAFLPRELGFEWGLASRRRLAEWHKAGVWDRLHQVLLAEVARFMDAAPPIPTEISVPT